MNTFLPPATETDTLEEEIKQLKAELKVYQLQEERDRLAANLDEYKRRAKEQKRMADNFKSNRN